MADVSRPERMVEVRCDFSCFFGNLLFELAVMGTMACQALRPRAREKAEPAARANGPERPWLTLNVGQKMKLASLILVLVAPAACFAGLFDKSPPVGPAFKIHGRLSVACGTPSCRIWIVGTKRILGIAETDPPETALMPERLSTLLTTQNVLFGDFTVVPLTKDETGVMRIVRVIAAENIVETDGSLHFIRRVAGKIEEEPNSERSAAP